MVFHVGRCTGVRCNGYLGNIRDTHRWRVRSYVYYTCDYTRDKVMDCRDIIRVYVFVKFKCMLFVDSRISRQRWLYDGWCGVYWTQNCASDVELLRRREVEKVCVLVPRLIRLTETACKLIRCDTRHATPHRREKEIIGGASSATRPHTPAPRRLRGRRPTSNYITRYTRGQ